MNTEEVQSKRMAKYQQTVGNKKEQDIEHEKVIGDVWGMRAAGWPNDTHFICIHTHETLHSHKT